MTDGTYNQQLIGSYSLPESRDIICRCTAVVARVNLREGANNNALLLVRVLSPYLFVLEPVVGFRPAFSHFVFLCFETKKTRTNAGCELMTKSRVRKLDISSVRNLPLVVPTILIIQRELVRRRLLLIILVVATLLRLRQLQQGRKMRMTPYEIRNVQGFGIKLRFYDFSDNRILDIAKNESLRRSNSNTHGQKTDQRCSILRRK